MMSAYIEQLGYQRSLQPNIDFFRHLINEQRGDGVDLQEVGLEVGVDEDVEPEEVEVVVEGRELIVIVMIVILISIT